MAVCILLLLCRSPASRPVTSLCAGAYSSIFSRCRIADSCIDIRESTTIQQTEPSHLSVMGGHDIFWVIGIALPTFLLLMSESSMYQKFCSADNEVNARRAVLGIETILEMALLLHAVRNRRCLCRALRLRVYNLLILLDIPDTAYSATGV